MEGWVKLYRKSLDSSVFSNPNLWQVWTYCLMRANHRETKIVFNGEEIILLPGSFITGRFQGAKDCFMKESTFRDQLSKLEKMKNLDIKSDNKKSLITVVKWASYQGEDFQPDSTSDNNPTTTRHRQECKNERKIKSISIQNIPGNSNGEVFYKNSFFFISQKFKDELIGKLGLNNEILLKEFYKMEKWLEKKGAKKDYERFIVNWLSKVQKPTNEPEFKFTFNPIPPKVKYEQREN